MAPPAYFNTDDAAAASGLGDTLILFTPHHPYSLGELAMSMSQIITSNGLQSRAHMKRLVQLSNGEAKAHSLKGSSYFNGDMPSYISFDPILAGVDAVLNGQSYSSFKCSRKKPNDYPNVNYSFVANKDGKFAWRPYELMHPVIYVSLVDVLCKDENWTHIAERLSQFEGGCVDCCSAPVMSLDHQTDTATQVRSWWHSVEQRSLIYSLEFSHVLYTDVTDCYGSIYTHSIAWALHGMGEAKANRSKPSLLGNKVDAHIQASRYGQTNGISQGSVLMDFVAEIVLGYVDQRINEALGEPKDFRILRYRDDYRIFANNDEQAEVTQPKSIGIPFESTEPICQIVNGESVEL